MAVKRESVWVVEYVKNGQRVTKLSYPYHSTSQEAIDAFVKQMGGQWEEHEKEGAKVVKKEITKID